jgi:hypothetical protein
MFIRGSVSERLGIKLPKLCAHYMGKESTTVMHRTMQVGQSGQCTGETSLLTSHYLDLVESIHISNSQVHHSEAQERAARGSQGETHSNLSSSDMCTRTDQDPVALSGTLTFVLTLHSSGLPQSHQQEGKWPYTTLCPRDSSHSTDRAIVKLQASSSHVKNTQKQ